MTEKPTVICCRCKSTFQGFSETQANDCAADVELNGIHGHYGSAVADMHILRYPGSVIPEGLTVGAQVCDPCLTDLLEKGLLLPAESRLSANPSADHPATGRFTELDSDEAKSLLAVLDSHFSSGESS